MIRLTGIATLGALLLATPALAETRTLDVGPFTAIDIATGIDAEVSIGATQSVTVTAVEDKLLDEVTILVEDHTLKAHFDWSIWDLFTPPLDRQIKLTITVPALTSIEASSGADVTAVGITGDSLEFDVSSGAGIKATGVSGKAIKLDSSSGSSLEISGTCETGEAESSSGSDLDASELECVTMDARASSGSDLEVFASKAVKADASSGADLTIHGKPLDIEQEASSGADIELD